MTLGTNSMWDAAIMKVIKFAYSNFFYIWVNFNHQCDCILYACMIHPCNIKCSSISNLLDYVSSLILHLRVLCKRTIWGLNVKNFNSHQTFNLLEITQGWGSLGKKWPMWSQEPICVLANCQEREDCIWILGYHTYNFVCVKVQFFVLSISLVSCPLTYPLLDKLFIKSFILIVFFAAHEKLKLWTYFYFIHTET